MSLNEKKGISPDKLEKGKKYFVCSNSKAFEGTFDKQVNNNNGGEDYLLFDNIEDSTGFKYEGHSMPVGFFKGAMLVNSDSTQINNPTATEPLEETISKDPELLKLLDEYANFVNKILTVNGKFPSGNLPNILYETIQNTNNSIRQHHNGNQPMINLHRNNILRGELFLPYVKYAIKHYYSKDNGNIQTNINKIEECLVNLPKEYQAALQQDMHNSNPNIGWMPQTDYRANVKRALGNAGSCFTMRLGFDSLFWHIIMEHFHRQPQINDVTQLLTIGLNILKRIQFLLNAKTGGKKKKRRKTIRHKRRNKKRYSRKRKYIK